MNNKAMSPPYTYLSLLYPGDDWQKFSRDMLVYIMDYCTDREMQPSTALDIACGTGTFVHGLLSHGIDAVGFDLCESHIQTAMQHDPSAHRFWIGDMRQLQLQRRFDLVTCLFDSFNYIIDRNEAIEVLRNAHTYLNDGGLFVFDTNTMVGHAHWDGSTTVLNEDPYLTSEGTADSANGLASLVFTMQLQSGELVQERHTQRSYDLSNIPDMLKEAGLTLEAAYKCMTREDASKDTARICWFTHK